PPSHEVIEYINDNSDNGILHIIYLIGKGTSDKVAALQIHHSSVSRYCLVFQNESTQSRGRFYLHHGDARHAGPGIDRASFAEAHPDLSRWERDQRSHLAWHFRHCLRADAIFLFAGLARLV